MQMLQEGSDKFAPEEEYKNTDPADKVIKKYGLPEDLPRYLLLYFFFLFLE